DEQLTRSVAVDHEADDEGVVVAPEYLAHGEVEKVAANGNLFTGHRVAGVGRDGGVVGRRRTGRRKAADVVTRTIAQGGVGGGDEGDGGGIAHAADRIAQAEEIGRQALVERLP